MIPKTLMAPVQKHMLVSGISAGHHEIKQTAKMRSMHFVIRLEQAL